MRRDEPKSVLENVARLERENADLKAKIAERLEQERAQETLEETIHTRPRGKASTLRFAAALSFGVAFGLVTLAVTLLLMPARSGGYDARDVRGGSAGVCR
jgi:Flp pilus assembly protein TadB